MISVAAELVGMHPQTLRIYESKGLVRPGRTPGGTRLYSEHDLDRLRLIQRLTTELGLNLAGVERVLALEDELAADARPSRPARGGDARRRSSRCTASTGATSCVYREAVAVSREERGTDGLQQADDQVPGGGRRRAGARAPPRQPGALPRAPAARAPRPGSAARARRRSADALRAEAEAKLAQQAAHSRARRSSRGASAALLEGPRPRRRRGAEARGRLRLDRAPPARARRRAARRAAREDQGGARRPARHLAGSGGHLPGAREVRPRPDGAGGERQARPGDRPRRGDPPRDPGALAADEEQPGADRRSRRRQDRDRRGARAADRRRRRPRGAEGQARLGARHRRAARRLEVPRRVRGAAEGRPHRDPVGRRRDHPLHRRAAHDRRRGRGRGRRRRGEHAQAAARPRRAPLHRRDHARRVPQAHREGRRARAALPAGVRRRAVGVRHDRDPARPEGALRGPPRRRDPRRCARRRGGALRPLHLRPPAARQGDRPDRRGGVAPADGDRLLADRARRGRAARAPARDRARGDGEGVEGSTRAARARARRGEGTPRRARRPLVEGEGGAPADRRDQAPDRRAEHGGRPRRAHGRPAAGRRDPLRRAARARAGAGRARAQPDG